MAVEVRIPTLGESVTEGVIVRWAREEGERVERDEVLLELETDKASMEITAEAAGVLHVLKAVGATVTVGEVVARIEESLQEAPAPPPPSPAVVLPPAAAVAPPPAGVVPAEVEGAPAVAAAPLSPAVRRLVEEHALAAAAIEPSGPGGRLTKADVLAHLERAPAPGAEAGAASGMEGAARAPAAAAIIASAAHAPAAAAPAIGAVTATPPLRAVAAAEGEEPVPMTRLRKRIAERLVEAQRTAAILTTFNEIDMSAVMALRAAHKERFKTVHGIGLGFMSFFARACVAALAEFPAINAEIRGDAVVYKRFVHLGIAVGTERGLVVPVVRHAERMSFAAIEREIERLAGRARDGKLAIEELAGGTFTISNGGVYGSLLSTPILNPPQSGILGMHKIERRAVVVGDAIVIRPMMYVALSYDHRIVDGEQAVTFLVRVKERIEDPARLLLDV